MLLCSFALMTCAPLLPKLNSPTCFPNMNLLSPLAHPAPPFPSTAKVFVGIRVRPGTIALKSAHGKYLSCDKFGVTSLDADAVGPQQEWQYVLRPDGVSFESAYGKFLKFEEGSLSLRADSESAGFCEVFAVCCQAARRVPAKKKSNNGVDGRSVADIEKEHAKKFQSWGGGRVHIKEDVGSSLKAAKKAGALYETLLDRREQTKADKFCK